MVWEGMPSPFTARYVSYFFLLKKKKSIHRPFPHRARPKYNNPMTY